MTRVLDIAKMLGKSEIPNTDNKRLVTANDTTDGVDSSAVSSITQETPLNYYLTLDSLPTSNLTLGDRAFVQGNRRMYTSNGSGWYNTGLVGSFYNGTFFDSTARDSAEALYITVADDFGDASAISPDGLRVISMDKDDGTFGTQRGNGRYWAKDSFGDNFVYTNSVNKVVDDRDYDWLGYAGVDVAIGTDNVEIVVAANPLHDRNPGTIDNSGLVMAFGKSGLNFGWHQNIEPDGGAGDEDDFGWHCQLTSDAERIVTGARHEDYQEVRDDGTLGPDNWTNIGAMYVFRRDSSHSTGQWPTRGYIQEARIIPPNNYQASSIWFGWHPSISGNGNMIATGTLGAEPRYVHAYRRADSDWIHTGAIRASGHTAQFGRHVAFDYTGDLLAIGDMNNDKCHVYHYDSGQDSAWTEVATLTGTPGTRFGRQPRVSGDGQWIIVTAEGDSDKGSGAGAIHVFHKGDSIGSWNLDTKLYHPFEDDGYSTTNFGLGADVGNIDIDSDGTTIIGGKGGPKDSAGGADFGVVWAFKRTRGL